MPSPRPSRAGSSTLDRHAGRPDARGRPARALTETCGGRDRATRRRSAASSTAPPPRRGSSVASVSRWIPDQVVACIGTKELVASLPARAVAARPDAATPCSIRASPTRPTRWARRWRGCVPFRSRSTPAGTSTLERGRRRRRRARARPLAQRPGEPDRRRQRPRRAWPRPWPGRASAASSSRATSATRSSPTTTRAGPPPPVTALGGGSDGVLAVHSLSKRSNMAGLRAGFVAGDADLVGYLGEIRKHGGLMTPAPVQAAATAALARRRPRRRAACPLRGRGAQLLLPALEEWGLVHDGGPSTFYLWLRPAPAARGGRHGWCDSRRRLAETGLLVAPGRPLRRPG